MPTPTWLNRTVVGAGLTSFLADVGYELATALLPSFLLILGLPNGMAAQVLGAIEAVAEFISNAAKLLVGWWSDRIGQRKAFVVTGYALTGSAFALCAFATAWPLVMVAKSLAWLGKGIRGPLRNAIITDAVDPAHRGKAFGFHRAGDTLGAVIGPLIAAWLLWQTEHVLNCTSEQYETQYRRAFWFTLIPGLCAALTFALLIREQRFTPKPGLRLGASIASMPRQYRHFLIGVAIFGLGDFSHTMLILATIDALQSDSRILNTLGFDTHMTNEGRITGSAIVAIVLYAFRNLVQALAAFPAGWLGDRFSHRRILAYGYGIGTASMMCFAFLNATQGDPLSLWFWLFAFALAGIYMAIQEALEPAIVAELVPEKELHGTAYGLLAVVNGFGDVGASLMVGGLVMWFGWTWGLLYAALMMALGAFWLATTRSRLTSAND